MINVGDQIKSFHFQPMSDRPDRYVLGTVTGVSDHMISFNADFDVIAEGNVVLKSSPMDGLKMQAAAPGEAQFMEWFGRLAVVEV